MTNGVCDDCKHEIRIGEWPYDCGSDNPSSHILYIKLMFQPSGRTTEYAPPTSMSPMKGPQITRDWMNADGSTRPMKENEWNKEYVGKEA